MTFNHEDALNGAPVWCGKLEMTVLFDPRSKTWCTIEGYEWDINGNPVGSYLNAPPLTTIKPKQ